MAYPGSLAVVEWPIPTDLTTTKGCGSELLSPPLEQPRVSAKSELCPQHSSRASMP